MKKKYIVLATDEEEFMVDFPDSPLMFHSEVASHMLRLRKGGRGHQRRAFNNPKIVSAGFVDSKGKCHGKSDSLGIGSREHIDTLIYNSGGHRYLPI